MDAFKELITPLFGGWTALVLVVTAVVVWVINKLPSWFSSGAGALRGSPTSLRYWRSRMAEAIAQVDNVPEGIERDQLVARVTEARIMVEAHEAKKRLGMGGAWTYWVSVIIFMLAASVLYSGWINLRFWYLLVLAVLAAIMTIALELLALRTSSATATRVNVLAQAGRCGHSDLVRADPWRVMRVYDYWLERDGPSRATMEKRKAADKTAVSRLTRFDRGLIGLAAFHSGPPVAGDIWSE